MTDHLFAFHNFYTQLEMSSLNQSVHGFARDLVKVLSVAQTWHEIQLDSQQSRGVFF